jgi:Xaa-Pro aminopeptidase
VFAARRQRFLEAMGPDAVAFVLGARPVVRSNDTEYPFRQDSDFWYLTGFGHPEAAAVLRTDGGPAYTLFVQPREREAEVWTGYRPGTEGALAEHGADAAHPIGSLHDALPGIVERARRIYHQPGRDPAFDQRLFGILDAMWRRSRAGLVPASDLVDPRSILHEMRLFKDADEVAIMRRAQAITREAHAEAARIAHGGRFEYELAAVLDYTFRRRGGSGPAYTSIVGGGRNAAVLHYVTNDRPLADGELVLIDAGAEFEGYAADVTRTYPVGGRFEPDRRAVYDVVLAAQEAALARCRPGATLDEIHEAALRALVEGMVSLGLLSGGVDDLVARDAYRRYFMHRTSHWLGLDVHDPGLYVRGAAPRPLEPGMVFTVEPGLYVAADDEKAPARLRGIGVRIEDDVLVTEDGCENLSAAIPKQPDEVEALVKSA